MTIALEFKKGKDGNIPHFLGGKHKDVNMHSEDVITSNVFGLLKYLPAWSWLPVFLPKGYELPSKDCAPLLKLWESYPKPGEYPVREGDTEVDVSIHLPNYFLLFIEAKYLNSISTNTKYGKNRDQLQRSLDVGLEYAGRNEQFFLVYLTPARPHNLSDIELRITETLQNIDEVCKLIPHRVEDARLIRVLNEFKWLHWEDLANFISQNIPNLQGTLKEIALDIIKYIWFKTQTPFKDFDGKTAQQYVRK